MRNVNRPTNSYEDLIRLELFINKSLFRSETDEIRGNESTKSVFEQLIRDVVFATMDTPPCPIARVDTPAGNIVVINAFPAALDHGRPSEVGIVFGCDAEAMAFEFLGCGRGAETSVFGYVDSVVGSDMVFYRCTGPEDVDEESMDGVGAIEIFTAVACSITRGDPSIIGEYPQVETRQLFHQKR